jgi:Flp pilus assembly protein TadG
MNIKRRLTRQKANRKGVVAVELAVTAPVILLLFFGMWEACRLINIRETLAVASMEGARKGVVPGATATDATNAAKNICSLVGVNNPTIATTLTSATATVTITVPLDQYAWVTPFFLKGKTLRSTTTLKRN